MKKQWVNPATCWAIMMPMDPPEHGYKPLALFPDNQHEAERLTNAMNATFVKGDGPFVAALISEAVWNSPLRRPA